MSRLPRVAAIVLPILRASLPGISVVTWVPDVDHRSFPFVQARRLGGARHSGLPTEFGLPVIELSANGVEGLPETEQLYEDTLEALYEAASRQTQTPAGYIHSVAESVGAMQLTSEYQDAWRVQGLIRLGIRPPRS